MDLEEAQKSFARWVDVGAKLGLALLAAGFTAYASGLLPPQVPPGDLAKLWQLPLAQFVAAAGAPTGWQWLALAGRGDYVNFVGIFVLASTIIAAYLRILPLLARHNRSFAAIATIEIVVLLAAASGLLNSFGGGHP